MSHHCRSDCIDYLGYGVPIVIILKKHYYSIYIFNLINNFFVFSGCCCHSSADRCGKSMAAVTFFCGYGLTHWGRVTHISVSKLSILGSDNGLSPGRRQAIIWTNGGILLIGPLGTIFSEILIGIQTFSFTKMHSKMSSAKWRPFVSASMC